MPFFSQYLVMFDSYFLFDVIEYFSEPEKDTNNILLMVGIAAGALIFLAVLIPLVVFMCRNCCLKGAVSPDQEEEEDKNKIKKKVIYPQFSRYKIKKKANYPQFSRLNGFTVRGMGFAHYKRPYDDHYIMYLLIFTSFGHRLSVVSLVTNTTSSYWFNISLGSYSKDVS